MDYVDRSLRLYRKTRKHVQELCEEVRVAGFDGVHIETETESADDITDICKLTCLEQGLQILNGESESPTLRVRGPKVHLEMEPVR